MGQVLHGRPRSTPSLPPAERLLMSTFRFSPPLASLAFMAALPLAIGTHMNRAHAQQVLSLKDLVPTITTNGVASSEFVPDIATISLGVDTERPNAANAARDNARAAQAIVSEIKAQGIETKDIKTVSVTLTPVYDAVTDANGSTKQTLRGYNAHNSLSVRVREIEKAGFLAGQLMDKGANSFGELRSITPKKRRNTTPCAATPFATPCARPIATSMGSASSSGGSWRSRHKRPNRLPLGSPGCRREAPRAPLPPSFPSSLAPRRCEPKSRSPGNSRSNN